MLPHPTLARHRTSPGRPISVKPIFLPLPESGTGYEMDPRRDILRKVQEEYLSKGSLPPGLQPRPLKNPAPLRANKNENIQRGLARPRKPGL